MPSKNQTNAANAMKVKGSEIKSVVNANTNKENKLMDDVNKNPVDTTNTEMTPPKEKKEKPPVILADPIEPLTRVIYPQVSVTVCGTSEQHGMSAELVTKIQEVFKTLGLDNLIAYAPPLTAIDAMGLIGWEVEQKDGPKFGDDYHLKDYYGNKVRLCKDIKNRPIYPSNMENITQNILTKKWKLNGEPLIFSDTGNTLDGQHTLPSLIIAQQRLEYEKIPGTDTLKWLKYWPDGIIRIPKILVFGIKGTDEVVNTMNTCRPRSFGDILYRSPYFDDLKMKSKDGKDRDTAAKVTDSAVKEVWQRTALYLHGYGNIRTNSEGASWLESHGGMHGKFLECVRFILDEDTTGHISKHIPCGKAVCMMWLGACGKSDQETYYRLRNEDKVAEAYMSLKWHNWKYAVSFWKEFGDREPDKEGPDGQVIKGNPRGDLKALTTLLDQLKNADEPMVREKDFLIARAWNLWIEEKPVTMNIKITDKDYGDPEGPNAVRHLKKERHLRFGNIDLGMDRIKPEPKSKRIDPTEENKLNDDIEELKRKTMEEFQKSEDEAARIRNEGKLSEGTTDKLASLKPQVQQEVEALHVMNPDVQVIAMKTFSGKCEIWGSSVDTVSRLTGVEHNTHPNDSKYIKFDVDDFDTISNKVTDAGYSIGLGDKVDGKLELIMVCRPANPKNGVGQKKK